ncbi:PH domain-containing protein [Pseudoxanthomonas sp. J35]|uniref:PH domain-containing protein n=1 Tax=Pseudoxanthomonas sp. J35 TaxID=935852 RepID=UPI00048E07F4|nr:PH domain-containing protein [Pseudoxanthomonas sp. J35]
MTDSPDVPLPPRDAPELPPATDWQPLPRRGALLYASGLAIAIAIPSALALGQLLASVAGLPRVGSSIVLGVLGLALGTAIGLLRHRRIGWKLDRDGFATRRGGIWRTETLVPVSRVQHLDVERGPLERQLGLATLVVHTAGTRMAAVKLPLLALEDAEALRARLARQVETDDAL